MEYYYCKEDKYNNIHSIDNVIITYFLTCTLDFALGHIKMISDCSSNYWEKLNVSRCSRYCYFNNIIHFDDGIFLKLGKYGMWLEDSKKFELLPKFQLEVNPNKHFKKDSFKRIIDFIEHYCSSGNLDKYDYAIDFPGKSVDDIQIFSSRKEKVCIRVLNIAVSVIRMVIVKFMIRVRSRKQMILLLVWSIHVLEIVLCLLKNYIYLIPLILPICLTLVLVGDYWLNRLYDFEKMG